VKLIPASEVPSDQLSEFFGRISEGEQAFLEENVRDPETVAAWRGPDRPAVRRPWTKVAARKNSQGRIGLMLRGRRCRDNRARGPTRRSGGGR
jgi:hypothetical protein